MSDDEKSDEKLPKAQVEKSWAFSWFWIVPLLALGFIGWLIYRNFIASGPMITIVFDQAKGLEEGKSIVKYRGAEIGTVEKIHLAKNYKAVLVHAKLHQSGEDMAREGARFWIVKPEIALGQVRALNTIVSGDYIEMEPGNGNRTNHFIGLADPPILMRDHRGIQLMLWADKMGAVSAGSPVYYRDLQVGQVLSSSLTSDNLAFLLKVWIDEQYASLVGTNSKFWNAGGINIQASLSGIDVQAETPKALLSGAVAFASPNGPKGKVSENQIFQLYHKPLPEWTGYSKTNAAGSRITIHFKKAHGLAVPADLKYRDLKIGSVIEMRLNHDNSGITLLADLDIDPSFFTRTGTAFWIVHPELSAGSVKGLQTLGGSDYIEIRPGEGKPVSEFIGLEEAPALEIENPGLQVVLLTDKLGSIQKGTQVFYRGIKIGEVIDAQLGAQSQTVEIRAQIERHFAPLVRRNSKFYNVGGINVDLSFLGADIRAQSLKTLIGGGIALATPDVFEEPAPNGTAFRLYEKADDNWLGWAPPLQLERREDIQIK